MTHQEYLQINNKSIFITPLIGYLNATFVDSGEKRKILCYTIDGKTPIIFNPIRYFDSSLIGNTMDTAEVESNTYIATTAGTTFDNKTSVPGYVTNKSYGKINLKQITGQLPGSEENYRIQSVTGSALSATVGNYYIVQAGTIAITLPEVQSDNVKQIVFFITTDSDPNVTFTASSTIMYAENFEIEADSIYEVNALWNGTAWCIALIKLIENV